MIYIIRIIIEIAIINFCILALIHDHHIESERIQKPTIFRVLHQDYQN